MSATIEKPQSGDHGQSRKTAGGQECCTNQQQQQTTASSGGNETVMGSDADAGAQEKGPSQGTDKEADKKQESANSSTSPSERTNGIRKSSTTASKFKEKRPEPLKLNPNLNQDIPLDLSVKSAGNVPSGTMGNIFNLGPTNHHLTTLETPRIQWQDNDALLATGKARLFSSSTNASQRARVSSLIGESPPITPNTPILDTMFSSIANNLKPSNSLPHSASMVLESASAFEAKRMSIFERLAQSSRVQINQIRADLSNGTRRSCSTENLNFSANNDKYYAKGDKNVNQSDRLRVTQDEASTRGSKKNSISPLAIKNLTNKQNDTSSQNKFSYTNQQIASNLSDTQRSPTSGLSVSNGKSLTPTSVANATANLLNIHLNSPTGLSQSPMASSFDSTQRSSYKSPSFPTFDHELSPLDPLISSTLSQQQQQQQPQQQQQQPHNIRASSINFSSPTLNTPNSTNSFHRNMIASQQHQQSLASISSSATLNTPTLISPSQMKAGQLCFLQSPTLSPMSSVFDLPSPFLMFPPSAQNQPQGSSGSSRQVSPKMLGSAAQANEKARNNVFPGYNDKTALAPDAPPQSTTTIVASKSCDTLTSSGAEFKLKHLTNVSSTNDLSHLITSATRKIVSQASDLVAPGPSVGRIDVEDDVEMDIDCELTGDSFKVTDHTQLNAVDSRPATAIPQICVSDHQLEHTRMGGGDGGGANDDQRTQRDPLCKRSLSPKSFCVQVNNYQNERKESSSAPPDVSKRRPRPKVKTSGAGSCFNIACKNRASSRCESGGIEAVGYGSTRIEKPLARAQTSGVGYQQARAGRHHPGIRSLFPSTGHLLNTQTNSAIVGANSALGARSNSAEPAVYPGAFPKTRTYQYSSPVCNSNSAVTLNCCQTGAQNNEGGAFSNSAQLSKYNSLAGQNQTMVAGLNRPHIQTNPNHQFQQQSAANHAYYQPQQPQQPHQLHSTSAGELARIPNGGSNQQKQAIMGPANSYGLGSRQSVVGQFYQPQVPQHELFMRQNQLSNQQGVSSSLNRVDYLLSEHSKQVHLDHRRHMAGDLMCVDQAPGDHGSVINLLCNSDNCQRQMSHPQAQHRSSVVKSMSIAQQHHHHHHQQQQQQPQLHHEHHLGLVGNEVSSSHMHSMNSGGGGSSHNSSSNCAYRIDIEAQSDSRSNSSLDFANQFIDGPGRSHSEATSKKYHCDQCSKSFTRSDMLTRHKRLHSGDRPFQCNECKQEFSRSDHLSTHMRTHTGEKPYKCKMCSYSACRKDMITRHLKVHNRNPHSNECI